MTVLIALFGLLLASVSVWGVAAPRRLIDTVVDFWNRPSGLWLAIGVRVVFGIAFILAAPETRFPLFFQVFGYLMLIAAALIPIIGKQRLTRLIMWFTGAPLPLVRGWLVLILAFALFIVYAVL